VSDENLENLVFRCIERYMGSRRAMRYGLVTSWDPTHHRAKVAIQPEGTESGWVPVLAHMAGNGCGVMAGLNPGDGQTTGDLVQVAYQEGDLETGMIVGRVHNDVDKPPPVQAGEILLKHSSGATIFLDKNGVLTLTGSGGSTTVHDASGNITHTDSSGGVVKQSGGKVYLGSGSATLAVKLSDGSDATKVFGA
jgi:phage baseplate assembly protein gpV